MPNFDVAYHPAQSALEALIESIDRPGEYCTHGRLFAPLPRLEVAGAGLISFPVPPVQADALAAVAERAPYGRGPDTVLDRSVRDCWQIDAGQVDVGGGAWNDTLAQVVGRAAEGLGCPRERTEARLYKLLVYEPGGFFSAHRDSEKATGMVATLVISLPVAGTGGELVIRHKQSETVIDLRTEDPSELAFAAFYADCVHETRPVATGHRIVLVYQLLRSGTRDGGLERAPDYTAVTEGVAALLKQWDRSTKGAEKIVWLLEHEYSEEGLSFAALKNTDAAVARTLTEAARRAGCAVHAAILHIEEVCVAEHPQDLPYGYHPNDSDLEAGEVIDSDHWLDGWVAPDDARPAYGKLRLQAGELLPAGALDGVDPDDEWVNEATGNAGVEIERAYRSAGLVLWPRDRALAALADAGTGAMVAHVADELERSGQSDAEHVRLRGLAMQLIDAWPAARPGRHTEVEQSCRAALRLLSRLGDQSITLRFLRDVATAIYAGGLNAELAAVVTPSALRDWLPEFIRANLPLQTDGVIDLVWRLVGIPAAGRGANWQLALCDAAQHLLRAIGGALAHRTGNDGDRSLRQPPPPLEAATIRNLLALAWHFDLTREADAAAALLIEHPAAAPPGRALPVALSELATLKQRPAEGSAFDTLWRHAAGCLLARSAQPPTAPADWSQQASIPCRCPHCRRLQRFYADPRERVLRLPLRKELRRHVHGIIDGNGLDLLHETERKGRPYTLVCTKTRAGHRRRLAQYAEDVQHMRLLVEAAERIGATAATDAAELDLLRSALARAG
ncbi:MAG: 2OG-Fe(II) oxygenase [Spirochaetaceae bacterium]|nr:2OG-Fe(II) oxygenase [Spirochaetaceae bacterium]